MHGPAITGLVTASPTARRPTASKKVDKSTTSREEARGIA
jgi:hypothetical protein